MATGGMNLDEALNVGIPILLILITLGFVYTKFLEPWVTPHILKLWNKMKEKTSEELPQRGQEIVYGD